MYSEAEEVVWPEKKMWRNTCLNESMGGFSSSAMKFQHPLLAPHDQRAALNWSLEMVGLVLFRERG
jgi:hypothetical protein